jgi:hypothetical protein
VTMAAVFFPSFSSFITKIARILGNRCFFYLIVSRVVDFAVISLKGIEEAVVSCIV